MTSVFSVAMFAIPAGMLTWGFEAEAERLIRRDHVRRKREEMREGSMQSGSSTSSDTYLGGGESFRSSWNEYEAVILGGEDEGPADPDEAKERSRALIRRYFERMDVDGS